MLPIPISDRPKDTSEPLLQIKGIKYYFPVYKGVIFSKKIADIRAVDGIHLSVKRGETLGVVGESGCGKTTLGRVILRLVEPSDGRINFDGREITRLTWDEMVPFRRRMQIIFQDPYSSLDPRMTIGASIGEPLIVHGIINDRKKVMEKVAELLDVVGLGPEHYYRYPHEFSGGQRQRIVIARALILNPEFIVADEPVSALDISIQAQILNLFIDLQKMFGLTYLFITHDLSVAQYISDRIMVMYLGKVLEIGPADSFFEQPAHPYTKALIDSIPLPTPETRKKSASVRGEIPSPFHVLQGCVFHTRCAHSEDICFREVPELEKVGESHSVACHLIKTGKI